MPKKSTQTPTPRLIAQAFARDRIAALTDGALFMFDQEWRLEFEQLKALVAKSHQDTFGAFKKSAHAAIREDIAAQAGFLLGVEIGKRLTTGGAQ